MPTNGISNPLKRVGSSLDRRPWLYFMLWAGMCSFVFWAFGAHSYVRIPDNADSTLAAKLGIAHSIAEYGFTRWWTLALGGGSLMAKGVAGMWDTLLFLAFPGWLAYGLLMFLQRWLAGLFLYKLLRQSIELRATAALYAGMAYALFAQNWLNASWDGFTTYDAFILPGLPLFLYVLHHLVRAHGRRPVALALLVGGVWAGSGAIVFSFFLWPVVLLWFLLIERIHIARVWRPMLSAFIGYAAVGTVLNLPVLLHAPYSYRADWTAAAHWYGTEFHLRFFYSMLQSNLLPLILAGFGLTAFSWKNREVRAVWGLLLGTLILVALKPVYVWLGEQVFSFFNGVALERIYLALPFLFIVAGAMGLNAVLQHLAHRKFIAGMVAALVLIAVILQYVGQSRRMLGWMLAGSNYAAVFEQPQVVSLAKQHSTDPPFRVATIMAHRFLTSERYGLMPQYNAAFAWAAGLETADGYALIYPQTYQDYWMKVMQPMYDRIPRYKESFQVRGNRVELFLPSEEYFSPEATVPFSAYFNLDALSALNVRYIISNFRVEDDRLTVVSDGSEYLTERAGNTLNRQLLSEYMQGSRRRIPVYIYENRVAQPRVFLYPDSTGTVEIKAYTPDKIHLRVYSKDASRLVHSANWDSGWHAAVNGNTVPVEQYNSTLQAVQVPKGQSDVELHFYGW